MSFPHLHTRLRSKKDFAAFVNALGNALLAAAFIAYAGSFDPGTRAVLVGQWSSVLSHRGVRCASPFNFGSLLGDELTIAGWVESGLPGCDTA
eukprot:scaffold29405_cov31-Prasinocladus_malaysianus.AAC.1